MLEIIDKMIEYMESRDEKVLLTSDIKISIGDLSGVVIKILSWLKLEHKRRLWMAAGRKNCYKPLEVDIRYPWGANLKMLVEKEKLFQDCFVIRDGKLDFADFVTEEDKMEAREKEIMDKMPHWILVIVTK